MRNFLLEIKALNTETSPPAQSRPKTRRERRLKQRGAAKTPKLANPLGAKRAR